MKKQFIINSLVILFAISPALYLLATWDTLPEQFVTRFKFNETIEESQGKDALMFAAITISASAVLLYLLLRNLKRVDPKVTESTPKTGFNRLGTALCIMMTISNYLLILSVSARAIIQVHVTFAVVGLIIAIAGNYMNSLKPNYVAGIRLPWTLNDHENWRKTHLLASKLWFFGGIVLIIISLLSPEKLLIPILVTVTTVLVIIPSVYSYRIYKNKTQP